MTAAQIVNPSKRSKSNNTCTITVGQVHTRKGSCKPKHQKPARILFDTGCGGSLVHHSLVTRLERKKSHTTTWQTKAGTFLTSSKVKCNFTLPEFHDRRDITWKMYVDESEDENNKYDMIIGRDLLSELGVEFSFKKGTMMWDGAEVHMKDSSMFNTPDNIEEIFNSEPISEAERIQQIVNAKYCPADLDSVVKSCEELSHEEQQQLLKLLQKYASLFDGTLGSWNMTPVKLDLKSDAKPYHAKPYPVPFSQEEKLKEEINRLVEYGILRKVNDSEWAAPMFTIPKPDGSLRSLADFRELNKRIVRKPFPIPKIQDMLQKMRGFQWATALDLNMGTTT